MVEIQICLLVGAGGRIEQELRSHQKFQECSPALIKNIVNVIEKEIRAEVTLQCTKQHELTDLSTSAIIFYLAGKKFGDSSLDLFGIGKKIASLWAKDEAVSSFMFGKTLGEAYYNFAILEDLYGFKGNSQTPSSFISIAAPAKNVGLGGMLGTPPALSGKFFMGATRAVDLNLSFSDDSILVFGDYLAHFPGTFGKQNAFIARLTPYVGVGPTLAFSSDDDDDRDDDDNYFGDDDDDDFAIGGRIPLGVEWIGQQFPIGVALELAPGLVVLPETDAFIHASLIVRYYF